mmetsp:Transcript_4755/g.17071  ORF Transcript_4755/g.17071 Transcript_4755/m.17071 type:complete len:288 (-) Transcript_4755:34-897(-)
MTTTTGALLKDGGLLSFFTGKNLEEIETEPPSVLSQWNSYVESRGQSAAKKTDDVDVEAQASATAYDVRARLLPKCFWPALPSEGPSGAFRRLFGSPPSVLVTRCVVLLQISSVLTQSVRSISGLSTSMLDRTNTAVKSVPSSTSYTYFIVFLFTGGVFVTLAFTIFLPVIILAPQKFALCFSIGCFMILGSFAALKGAKEHIMHMMSKERLPFTGAYLGSTLLTLWAAMIAHSYVLSVIFSGAQFVAVLYYSLSYFPGGAAGVTIALRMLKTSVTACISGIRTMVG